MLLGDELHVLGEVTGLDGETVRRRVGRLVLLDRDGRGAEAPVEQAVSAYLATLSVVCFAVDDEPGPDSKRGLIEQNLIGLLSSYGKESIDPPSQTWLGHSSKHPLVAGSGLWNQQHVEASYDPQFLGSKLNKSVAG